MHLLGEAFSLFFTKGKLPYKIYAVEHVFGFGTLKVFFYLCDRIRRENKGAGSNSLIYTQKEKFYPRDHSTERGHGLGLVGFETKRLFNP